MQKKIFIRAEGAWLRIEQLSSSPLLMRVKHGLRLKDVNKC